MQKIEINELNAVNGGCNWTAFIKRITTPVTVNGDIAVVSGSRVFRSNSEAKKNFDKVKAEIKAAHPNARVWIEGRYIEYDWI